MTNSISHSLGSLRTVGATPAFPFSTHRLTGGSNKVTARGLGFGFIWVAEQADDDMNWQTDGGGALVANGIDVEQSVELSLAMKWLRVRAIDSREANMAFTLDV